MRAFLWPWLMVALFAVEALAEARPSPRMVYRFSASASLFARPGVADDGSLYVGAGDGNVHALGPDGSFRWSYTVKGRVLAPPLIEASSGHVFVATSDARLYALDGDSQLRWVLPLPAAPKTELVLTPTGILFYVGQDGFLYGVTTGGVLSLRLAAPKSRSAPALLSGARLGLVLGEHLAILKGYGFERRALAASFGADATLALGPDSAVFACEEGVGRVERSATELAVAADCAWPPVRGDGFFAVASAGGELRLYFADGSLGRVALGAALLSPSWDAPRRRLVASSATGAVSVLELVEAAN
ncbi:MAG TPA: PQQ-binding-like beta-propeller repeat protein [Polyangiaceae bacterium]|nr:PQQ-binding-like beta-propeller repeat protein [Polyangiaceae bacterium]